MNNLLNCMFLQCSKAELYIPYSTYKNVYYKSQNVILYINYVYALNKNTHVEFKLPSIFESSDIEPISTQLKLHIHFTKSPKHDNTDKLLVC